jgi:hypothetical protein
MAVVFSVEGVGPGASYSLPHMCAAAAAAYSGPCGRL